MKVLHLLKSTIYSGAENVVITIMKNCMEHEMIYASPEGPIKNRVLEEGLVFYPIEQLSRTGVKKVIDEVQPDIVHAHDFSMSTYAAGATKKIPIISHLHNNPLWIRKIHPKTLLYLWSTRKYKKILTVSNAVEQEFLFSDLFSSKIKVLGNVINKEIVLEKAKAFCESKSYDVIFLGRLSSQKSPIYFCEIIERLKKELPDVCAAMLGSGEMEAEVREFISSHQLDKTIDLLGFQSNPYPYLNKGKILLMPSSWEGFGLVAVEAMILGKPVVCSGVGGLYDIVDESCGAICNTIDEYVEKLLDLLRNDTLYVETAQGAVKKSERYTNIQQYRLELQQIYSDVLKQ